MIHDLVQVAGGLGLFLLGMVVMTDALRGLAGDMLNRLLARFTNSPLSGAVSGALATAVLQSSSAMTVAAVGFVGAGLLTFTQALGVIFGANVGTTVTGWLVALLGLKLQLGGLLFPLILGGVLLRLFSQGRWRHAGYALAGFGLLFQGIAVLQAGMAPYQGLVMPADFPIDPFSGRLLLVLAGVAVTLVTQSSSAGVAATLTAVYTGTIGFDQAAALVIGMDVGTTLTAVLATLGGSVDARRTGYSHVIYNLMTASGALLLLSPYAWTWDQLAPGALEAHAELALVGFHTLFNILGVVVVLPFTGRFAALMMRLVPAPKDPVIDRLDRRLLQIPGIALDNVAQILAGATSAIFDVVQGLLEGRRAAPETLARLARHLDGVHAFVDQIHLQPESRDWPRLNASIHILDHLQRLHERCEEEPERGLTLRTAAAPAREARAFTDVLGQVRTAVSAGQCESAAVIAQVAAEHLRIEADRLRAAIMAGVAAGDLDVPTGTRQLESVRWLRRVGYHVWRVCAHHSALQPASTAVPTAPPPASAPVRADGAV